MIKPNRFAVTTAFCLFLSSQAFAQSSPDTNKPAGSTNSTSASDAKSENVAPQLKHKQAKGIFPVRSKVLRTTVTLTEDFPALPDDVRPGTIFDESKVQSIETTDNRWYRVPSWFAGEFSYGDMVKYEEKDYATGKTDHKNENIAGVTKGRHRGILVDKLGNIWQQAHGGKIGDPSHPDGQPGDIDAERYEDANVGVIISPKEYAETSAGVEFYIDKKTKKIIDVVRYERIRYFTLEEKGAVAVNVSELKYDLNGNPLFLLKMKGHMSKQSDFQALKPGLKLVNGTYADAVSLLRKYMDEIGKIADAPDEPDATTKTE